MKKSIDKFLAIFGFCALAGMAHAQEGATELQSDWYQGFADANNVRAFVSQDFSCEDFGSINEYYLVFEDDEFNSDVERVAATIWKSLLAFDFERGKARCVYNGNKTYKFRVIGLYDDEQIIDVTFEAITKQVGAVKPGVRFKDQAAAEDLFEKIKSSYRPVQ